MSQEEEDQLLGQAVREKAQVERTLALTDQEIERLRTGLTDMVNGLAHRSHALVAPPVSVPPAVSKYLDCSKLIALLEEQNRLMEKRTALTRAIEGSR